MRLVYPAAFLALCVTAGCNKPVDQQKPQADAGPQAAQASADVQLVKLNLPNMT